MFGMRDSGHGEGRHLLYLLLVWGCPLPAGSERKNSWAKMMEARKGERVIKTGLIRGVMAVIGDCGARPLYIDRIARFRFKKDSYAVSRDMTLLR